MAREPVEENGRLWLHLGGDLEDVVASLRIPQGRASISIVGPGSRAVPPPRAVQVGGPIGGRMQRDVLLIPSLRGVLSGLDLFCWDTPAPHERVMNATGLAGIRLVLRCGAVAINAEALLGSPPRYGRIDGQAPDFDEQSRKIEDLVRSHVVLRDLMNCAFRLSWYT